MFSDRVGGSLPSVLFAWMDVRPAAGTSGWRVLAVDLRGNGRSGWAPGRYRLEDFTRDSLARIACPALFLRGERGRGAVMSDGDVSLVQGSHGDATCVEIPGVGHLLHLEEGGREPVLKAMMEFLEQIPRSPSASRIRAG